MATTKKRPDAHIIEKRSLSIVGDLLPDEWVIREYKPDYGIDLGIEIFEKDYDLGMYVTQGEHLYIQVKGTTNINFGKCKIYERCNVEKRYERADLYKEIDVVKFPLDTSELLTIEKMGSSTPVLLFVVDVDRKDIYYLPLNEYIEKVLIPEDRDYFNRKTVTIYIPCENRISTVEDCIILNWFSKRNKLFSMFNKIHYQQDSIKYLDYDIILEQCNHFGTILLRLDAWSTKKYWRVLEELHTQLINFVNSGYIDGSEEALRKRFFSIPDSDWEDIVWNSNSSDKIYSRHQVQRIQDVITLWNKLDNLSCLYEETCKEWFLPTYFNCLISE